jgi:hypothetical protein
MASNGVPISASVARIVQGSQASLSISNPSTSGKVLPGGNAAASLEATSAADSTVAHAAKSPSAPTVGQAAAPAASQPSLQSLVAQLNKYLNDSGRPDQYRVDPQSDTNIQEVNPANGAVLAEFSASEFPALARSVGASGLLVDSLA